MAMRVTESGGNVRRPIFIVELFQAFLLGSLLMLFMKHIALRQPVDTHLLGACVVFGALFAMGWTLAAGFQRVAQMLRKSER